MPTLLSVVNDLVKAQDQLWQESIIHINRNRRERVGDHPVLRVFTDKVGAYLQKNGYTFEEVADHINRRQDKLNSALSYFRTHTPKRPSKAPQPESAHRADSSSFQADLVRSQIEMDLKKGSSLFSRVAAITEIILQDDSYPKNRRMTTVTDVMVQNSAELKKHLTRIMPLLHPDRHAGVLTAEYLEVKALWDLIGAHQFDRYKEQLSHTRLPLLNHTVAKTTQPALVSTKSSAVKDSHAVAVDILANWNVIWSGIHNQAIAEGLTEIRAQERFSEIAAFLFLSEHNSQAILATPVMVEYMRTHSESPLTQALRSGAPQDVKVAAATGPELRSTKPHPPKTPSPITVAIDFIETWSVMWSGICKQAIAEGDETQAMIRFIDVIDLLLTNSKLSPHTVITTPQMATFMRLNPNGPLTQALRSVEKQRMNTVAETAVPRHKAEMKKMRTDEPGDKGPKSGMF